MSFPNGNNSICDNFMLPTASPYGRFLDDEHGLHVDTHSHRE